jgi:hypothetical protein
MSTGAPPIVTRPIPTITRGSVLLATQTRFTVTWSGVDTGSGIASYELTQIRGTAAPTVVALSSPLATSASIALAPGVKYRFLVRATDRAGNVSATVTSLTTSATLTQERASAVKYRGSWRNATSSSATDRRLKSATARNASATYAFTGTSISWVATVGRKGGSAYVYIDGRKVKTVSLVATRNGNRVVVFTTAWTRSGKHTIKIVVRAMKGNPPVTIDAFVVGH